MKILFIHTFQIKTKMKSYLKKIFTVLKIIFSLPLYLFWFPILLIIRIIKPIYLIRFSIIRSSRIGHFAGICSQYLSEKEMNICQPKNSFQDFFIFAQDISNDQIAKLYRSKINILQTIIINISY